MKCGFYVRADFESHMNVMVFGMAFIISMIMRLTTICRSYKSVLMVASVQIPIRMVN